MKAEGSITQGTGDIEGVACLGTAAGEKVVRMRFS
jgi:hypothetical protein